MPHHRRSIIIITIQAPYRLHLIIHMPCRLHLLHHHSIIQITLILRSCKIHTTQQHTNNIIQHSRRAPQPSTHLHLQPPPSLNPTARHRRPHQPCPNHHLHHP